MGQQSLERQQGRCPPCDYSNGKVGQSESSESAGKTALPDDCPSVSTAVLPTVSLRRHSHHADHCRGLFCCYRAGNPATGLESGNPTACCPEAWLRVRLRRHATQITRPQTR